MTENSGSALQLEFCRGPQGLLARRRLLGHYSILLSGEVYVEGVGGWRFAREVMDNTTYPTIDESEASEILADAAVLRGPCPTPADLEPHVGTHRKERLEWLDSAITRTLGEVEQEEGVVLSEMPWARPGSWDYDYEMDAVAWIRRAYCTLQSLLDEKLGIVTREQMRADTSYEE